MTVTYTADVSSTRLISNFFRLLFRWRGSIYKLIWVDWLVFLTVYLILAVIYRNCMQQQQFRASFESIVLYCNSQLYLIPLSFVMGYFVAIVMGRWWKQYTTIPWPDSIATLVSCSVHGFDDRARAMRRTILRYVCLCQVIVFTMISPSVKKRFPTYNQIIEAGLLQESEKRIIENLDLAFPHYPKHWMPIVWAASIVMRARRENKIRDDYAVKTIIDELNRFRGLCGFLLYFDWVSVPLVYTQVVTLATYTFFMCSALGSQWIDNPNSQSSKNLVVKYFPILAMLQFFFYMGWLKVAESLMNPFGDDDDDFEVNWMIDRNLTVSYLIVDEMHQEHPELLKDQYWNEVFPNELPYIDESQRTAPPKHSTAKLVPSKQNPDMNYFLPQSRHSFLSQNTSTPLDATTSLQKLREILKNQNESDDKPSSTSLNLEELIEQRYKEKCERMRHRFLNMRKPSSTGRGYVVTVLRPPTPRSSHNSLIQAEEEEEEHEKVDEENEEEAGEEEQTVERPDFDTTNKKPDKYNCTNCY